jgi:YD repeat-containing protein
MKYGQTIGQWLKWDFKTNGDLEIRDKNGKRIYYENSGGFWEKREYDSQGKLIYLEDSHGTWIKYERDSQGNIIYFEDSNGHWAKMEYDSEGNRIYFENSSGVIEDKRPKPCEDKIVEIEGVKYKLVKA